MLQQSGIDSGIRCSNERKANMHSGMECRLLIDVDESKPCGVPVVGERTAR